MSKNKKKDMAKNITKNICACAALLAICLVSQIFKNISVYITGPIINACLILAVVTVGYEWSVILSFITPITAFLITGNPLISAVPVIMPCIMVGNLVMVSMVSVLTKKKCTKKRLIIGMGLGSVLKAIFMGGVISLTVIPMFITETSPLYSKIGVFQTTMSITQLITAIIGSVFAFFIFIPLKKVFRDDRPEDFEK